MSNSLLIEILLGLIAAIIAFSSYVQARRANAEQVRMTAAQAAAVTATVDAGAFARAKDIYESAMDTLRDELASTRAEIGHLRQSNTSLISELESVRQEAVEARTSNNKLRAEIILLRAEIVNLQNVPPRPPALL